MEKYDIIFWIFFLIALVLLAWRILGESPGTESLIAALIASEFALWRYMYKHGRELAVIKTSVRNSFQLMRKDINFMKTDFKKDLGLIKKKLKIR